VVTAFLLYQVFGVLTTAESARKKTDFNLVQSWLKRAWPKRKKARATSRESAAETDTNDVAPPKTEPPEPRNEPPASIPLAGDSDSEDEDESSKDDEPHPAT